MKYKPWDHQLKAYNEVIQNIDNGERSQIVVIPTRGGKSWVIAKLIERFKDFGSVYFVAHTRILIKQMSEELQEHGIKHGIIAPWAPKLKYKVQVCSKDTLVRRLKKLKQGGWKDPVLIITEESHLSLAATWLKIINNYQDSLLLGFTGSPCRLDNKPLSDVYKKMVIGPQRSELIAKKILAPTETFAVEFDESGIKKTGGEYNQKSVEENCDKPKVLSDIADHWAKLALGKKTLTFCSTIKHAQDVAGEFNRRGYPSIAISSKDSESEINKKLDDYYSGKYINLCSVNLFVMGFTVKECECIIQARPTTSLMIYLQMIGRGGIYMPGKVLINIDAVNNWSRHGLPDDDIDWTKPVKAKEKQQSSLKRCPDCMRPVSANTRVCPHCGHQWTETAEAVQREIKEGSGTLINIKDLKQKGGKNRLVIEIARNARSLQQAISIAKKMGVDHKAAWYIWKHELKNG